MRQRKEQSGTSTGKPPKVDLQTCTQQHMNCAYKSATKTKIAQVKRRSWGENYLKLKANTRQREESKKSANTAKR